MTNDYLELVKLNSGLIPAVKQDKDSSTEVAIITLRVDADCMVYVDGEHNCNLKAMEIKNVKIPLGHHTVRFVSTQNVNAKVERVADLIISGKKHLIIVDDLLSAIQRVEERPARRSKGAATRKAR